MDKEDKLESESNQVTNCGNGNVRDYSQGMGLASPILLSLNCNLRVEKFIISFVIKNGVP